MLVFAHRGVSALHPENSQTALLACKETNIAGVEFDVFQSGDEFIVTHDRRLDRLFKLDRLAASLTIDEIAHLKCSDGNALPTLDWVFRSFRDSALVINIELKQVDDLQQLTHYIRESSRRHDFPLEQLLISSFHHTYLLQLSRSLPEVKLGLLLAAHPLNLSACVGQINVDSVHIDLNCANSLLIREVKSLGYKVFVYTVDHQDDIVWLYSERVDGIFANDPIQAHKIVTKMS